jgi:hypothetical protein
VESVEGGRPALQGQGIASADGTVRTATARARATAAASLLIARVELVI